jgi:hypothetical protein
LSGSDEDGDVIWTHDGSQGGGDETGELIATVGRSRWWWGRKDGGCGNW